MFGQVCESCFSLDSPILFGPSGVRVKPCDIIRVASFARFFKTASYSGGVAFFVAHPQMCQDIGELFANYYHAVSRWRLLNAHQPIIQISRGL